MLSPSEDEDYTPSPKDAAELARHPELKGDFFYEYVKEQERAQAASVPPRPRHWQHKGEDAQHNLREGRVYPAYEQLKPYRQEGDQSAYSGLDRVMAHLRARERSKWKERKGKEQVRREEVDEDDVRAFMSFLQKDSLAASAFERHVRESEQLADFSLADVELPGGEGGKGSEEAEIAALKTELRRGGARR